MRLSNVERGDRPSSRLLYAVARVITGYRIPDVVRTLRYHLSLFGRPHSDHTQAVMRGPSPLSPGLRELIAAYTSKQNDCES